MLSVKQEKQQISFLNRKRTHI